MMTHSCDKNKSLVAHTKVVSYMSCRLGTLYGQLHIYFCRTGSPGEKLLEKGRRMKQIH